MNLTIRQNTTSFAISQYTNFFFDRGIVSVGGKRIALNCNELVELGADTDNGTEISAKFQTGAIAYGDGEKRVRSIHVKGEFEDRRAISAKYVMGGYTPDFTGVEAMTSRLGGGGLGALKFNGARSKYGEHLSVLIENVSGKFFRVSSIVAFLINGCRR